MAYDEVLAERVRERLGDETAVAEKRMFGGLSFLSQGRLVVAVSGDDLLVRVGPERVRDALARSGARPAVMGSRTMRGWVRAAGETLDDAALGHWITTALTYTATLPAE
ncbi:TfoX/Sxy family protein [Streptomyces smyrnaeus]|uniref:TfoX/Sxy family protein n=1 Tax=Streptomyces smyrnaeus TaxID=1387713 RepID=A0ABS3XP78_9ACTN|nr:TfoX/Sxy family protein [Streptomyces smyrnaeus]MBO8196807.1 TfoX/Sxy family protein [Streptomyces smyrnaeus]